MKNIIGIGNALVDILCEIEKDELLRELELPKGSMQLVDKERNNRIQERIKNFSKKRVAGGSASNCMRGIAELGGTVSYIGRVGSDELGELFHEELIKAQVESLLVYSDHSTGNASTFISKDGERTFATYLGAAIGLEALHLDETFFQEKDILHIEGYLVQNHELVEKAVTLAKRAGMLISLDLASYNIVEENKDFLQNIIRNYVDIVFANEEEAKAYTGEDDPYSAVGKIAEDCLYAIVKIGKKGSLIRHQGQIYEIGTLSAAVVDTTGAGDLYASGFLYGLSMGFDIPTIGEIAKITSGNIIQVIGACMDKERWDGIREQVKQIETRR